MGIRAIKIGSHEELVKLDPGLKQSKNRYAGAIFRPGDRCINTFDFGQRIMKGAEKMGV